MGYGKLIHTTTLGEVIKIDENKIVISSEKVWKGDDPCSVIHAFPLRVIEEIILLCPKDKYRKLLQPLNVFENTKNI